MTHEILTTEPKVIIAGTTVAWTIVDSEHPAPTWAMAYAFRGQVNGFDVNAAASGEDHAVVINAATSGGYAPGDYKWQRTITGPGAVEVTKTGRIKVEVNLAGVSGIIDLRSHTKKVLDAIEAVLEQKATTDQLSYSIEGRSLARMSWPDLITAHSRYSVLYRQELDAEGIAEGLKSKSTVLTRFSKP